MAHRLQLRVKEKIRETDRAVTLVLDPGPAPLPYRPGQFLTFLFSGFGDPAVRRSYSLCSAPGIDPDPAITVQKVPNGRVSRFLVDTVQPGDWLTALAPAGQFTLTPMPETARDLFFFGGGSGITPLYSLLRTFLREEPRSHIHLLFANRNERSVIFRNGLRNLSREYPERFHCLHLLSEPLNLHAFQAEVHPGRAAQGHLSNFLVEQFVRQESRLAGGRPEFFLCGPRGLMLKTEQTLGFLGYGPEQIHKEIFTVEKPFRPLADRFPDARITLHVGERTAQFSLRAGETILEAARRSGWELPYSCLSGICTTCSVHCRSGKVEMYTQEGKTDTATTRGNVLTCVGYPVTPEVVLAVD